jgi:hypothetical protein
MSRVIAWQFFVDWDFDNTYTNESANMISASGSMRLHPPAAQITSSSGIVDRAQFVLRNPAGRYSPLNTSGALYAAIGEGAAYHAPCYLNVSIDGGSNYTRIFTGVMKIPAETGATSKSAPTVTLDCRSRDDLLLQKRLSSTLSEFVNIHDNGETEEQIIARWLTLVGLTDGTDFVSQAYAEANSVTATLDRGLWVVPWAWLDDESPLEEIWALAAACGGRFYCDPNGVFRYENAAHWLGSPHDTSQATLTRSSFERIRPQYQDGELFESVTVEVSPRDILDGTTIWEADTPITIPADGTKLVIAKMRQPVYALTAVNYTAITSGGLDISADVTVSARVDYAQRIEITLANAHATQAAVLVVLTITGQPVGGNRSEEQSKSSADSFWTSRTGRNRSVRGNPFIQTSGQGAMLAEFLRDWHERPRLFFAVDGVPGIPGRRLGDRLTLQEPDAMSVDRDAYLIGVTWTLGNTGYKQNYELIDATGLYKYGGDYFIIGTDKLGGVGDTDDPRRLFY